MQKRRGKRRKIQVENTEQNENCFEAWPKKGQTKKNHARTQGQELTV